MITAGQANALAASGSGGAWREVVSSGLATDRQILEAISVRFKVPVADLDGVDARVATLLPETLARKYQIVALGADDRVIRIAAADPRDLALEQTLAFVTGRDVMFLAAGPDQIAEKLAAVYRPEAAVTRLVDGLRPAEVEPIGADPPIEPPPDPSLDAPMARLVDAMIAGAVREQASQIHCEPLLEGTSVRYRIDGVSKEVIRLPASAGPALVRRVKLLARLDVTDPIRPHEGRCAVRVDGKAVDLRVSTVPIARRGEQVIIRIIDQENGPARIADLKLAAEEEGQLLQLLSHREGMVLVAGPTGSGRTTTLYAAIDQLRTGKLNIVTVEDPIEWDVAGISQLQVNETRGFTFASALRSLLRQDPDAVMVGEIRDGETAMIAVQASLSGHLVLSTVAANDAPSAVTRLRGLGADNTKIAAALRGIVAQRLVRTLCPGCAKPVAVDALPDEARPPARWRGPVCIRVPAGCKACSGTGYRGRTAIVEVIPTDETITTLIAAGAGPDELGGAVRAIGMRSLWESGLDRVWRGLTSLDEVIRVLGQPTPDEAVESPAAGAAGALPDRGVQPPERPAPLPEPPLPRSLPAENGPGRILIADDDRQMRRLLRMVLEREGYLVAEAGDGLEALDAIEAGQFDLMILDLDMPRLDGLGVLEELRARVLTASLPVIVLTARTGEAESRVLDLGAEDFLSKPVQPASLQARVRAVLRRARMQ